MFPIKLIILMIPYFVTTVAYFCLKICALLDKNDIAQSCVNIT